MSIGGDSLIEDMSKVVAGVLRRSKAIDFGALYGGTVLFSDGDRATVQPDDERLGPTLAQCRVRRPDGMTTYPVAEGGVRCLIARGCMWSAVVAEEELTGRDMCAVGHYLDTRHAATPGPHLERDAQKG